jgi:hypothetical protein
MRSYLLAILIAAALGLSLAGCESELSQDDVGQVSDKGIPKVAGADTPYKFKQFETKNHGDASDNTPTK